ncbi:hypothetical protein ACFC8F_33380 [Streptomyces hydrogenans]|uniref:hypothetical protein n=1 Tax=Streptomyces hydrogenans TaxID=1873719 RepID=UPI0035D95B4C
MEDPDVRVPLHARRVQVRPQDLVDHRLVAIHSGRPRRQHLARLRPGRIRSLPRRPPRQAVLALKLRIDMPPRWSRRIAAYSSTFEILGMTSAFHQEHPDAALTRTSAPPKPLAKRRRYWVLAHIP